MKGSDNHHAARPPRLILIDAPFSPRLSRYIFSRDDHLQRQLIIWTGGPPMILQRAKYDSHELFAGLADETQSDH